MAVEPLPGDFYRFADQLTDDERAVVARVRAFLEKEVAPVAQDHWTRAEFPHHLIPGFAALGIAALPYDDLDGPAARRQLIGFVSMEIAHTDPSMNSFFGIHIGLAMGSIDLCCSPEQRQRWLPAMARLERIGAFGLTEPHGGSDVARRLGDHGPPRGRHLGDRRREALDRQRHVRRGGRGQRGGARLRRRALPRRRRGAVLVRGHEADQHPGRRARDHRAQRVR